MKKLLLIFFSLVTFLGCQGQVSKTISQEVLQVSPFDSATYWRSARIGYNYKIRSTDYAAWLRLNYVLPDTVSTLATKYDLLSITSSPIEITRTQAGTHDGANSGDGDWIDGAFYRITNPLTPLSSVLLQAIKDKDGHPRLLTSGKAFTTTSPNVELEVGYNALTNAITYVNQPSQGNFISGSPTAYVLFDYTEPTAINNTIRGCYVSMGGGTTNFYSNNTAIGSSIVLNNAELSGSLLTGNASVNITGTSYLTSYVYLSKLKNANVTLTGDSKVDGCNFENITIAASGGSTFTNCTFIGNGESFTFPSGYSATGKTFISGVSSSFEYYLDCSDIAIYDATGSAIDGQGVINFPAGLGWVGKFYLANDYPVVSEIIGLNPLGGSSILVGDIATGGGYIIFYNAQGSTAFTSRICRNSTDNGLVGTSYDLLGTDVESFIRIVKGGLVNNVIEEYGGF